MAVPVMLSKLRVLTECLRERAEGKPKIRAFSGKAIGGLRGIAAFSRVDGALAPRPRR